MFVPGRGTGEKRDDKTPLFKCGKMVTDEQPLLCSGKHSSPKVGFKSVSYYEGRGEEGRHRRVYFKQHLDFISNDQFELRKNEVRSPQPPPPPFFCVQTTSLQELEHFRECLTAFQPLNGKRKHPSHYYSGVYSKVWGGLQIKRIKLLDGNLLCCWMASRESRHASYEWRWDVTPSL